MKKKHGIVKSDEKSLKTVFVIMPFTKTPARNGAQLTAFFENQIKAPIENGDFHCTYTVRRSDETFNITEQIVRDLYNADIVICDLSGTEANPNVMYELGIRLAFSNKPLILIREAHADNRQIFDIGGFYAESYDPLNYTALVAHIKTKITRLETGAERYSSPVLKIIGEDRPLLQTLSAQRAVHLLYALRYSMHGMLRLFSGQVDTFLKKRTKIKDFGKTPLDTLEILQKNAKQMNRLAWNEFHFHLGSQPALDHYLASRYLVDILNPDTEKKFTECLLDFHAHFYSGDTFWCEWHAGSVHTFVGEGLIIRSMTDVVSLLLLADAGKTQELTAQFEELYKKRHLS